MFAQIEITTVCNYHCFYCCGRDMPQKHISIERFTKIINTLPEERLTINLQGEGEPILHPQFDKIVEMTTEQGYIPYTITNGTKLPVQLINQYFPSIGISIDTIDSQLAEKIGRVNLSKVLKNLTLLIQSGYPSDKIVIHTVFFGQELEFLKKYIRDLGITQHIIQPLQVKEDYRYRYADALPKNESEEKHRCSFIDTPRMVYFNIDGATMPCCFIKQAALYSSREQIQESLQRGVVPDCCAGCRELY